MSKLQVMVCESELDGIQYLFLVDVDVLYKYRSQTLRKPKAFIKHQVEYTGLKIMQ
jgi:hypothetical protein